MKGYTHVRNRNLTGGKQYKVRQERRNQRREAMRNLAIGKLDVLMLNDGKKVVADAPLSSRGYL